MARYHLPPEALAVEASVSPSAFCVQLDGPLPSAPEALAEEAVVSPPAFCVQLDGAGSGGRGAPSRILCARPRSRLRYLSLYGLVTV